MCVCVCVCVLCVYIYILLLRVNTIICLLDYKDACHMKSWRFLSQSTTWISPLGYTQHTLKCIHLRNTQTWANSHVPMSRFWCPCIVLYLEASYALFNKTFITFQKKDLVSRVSECPTSCIHVKLGQIQVNLSIRDSIFHRQVNFHLNEISSAFTILRNTDGKG
jgi:hypothetical protein